MWYSVAELSPVMLLVNDVAPVPSSVRLLLVVGLGDVLQHTPFSVTEEVPPDAKLPPPEAVVEVMEDGVVVATAVRVVSS